MRELGGTGGKIMVYLRADTPEANAHNIAILRQCIEDFARGGSAARRRVPDLSPRRRKPEDYTAKIPVADRGRHRLCLDCGAKVLKLPYPGTAESCAAITRMAGDVPWAVLSAGVDHATFLGQVEIAMANGASGVIAGRSLWKDCISLDRAVSAERLESMAVPRLREIQAVIARYRAAAA